MVQYLSPTLCCPSSTCLLLTLLLLTFSFNSPLFERRRLSVVERLRSSIRSREEFDVVQFPIVRVRSGTELNYIYKHIWKTSMDVPVSVPLQVIDLRSFGMALNIRGPLIFSEFYLRYLMESEEDCFLT